MSNDGWPHMGFFSAPKQAFLLAGKLCQSSSSNVNLPVRPEADYASESDCFELVLCMVSNFHEWRGLLEYEIDGSVLPNEAASNPAGESIACLLTGWLFKQSEQ